MNDPVTAAGVNFDDRLAGRKLLELFETVDLLPGSPLLLRDHDRIQLRVGPCKTSKPGTRPETSRLEVCSYARCRAGVGKTYGSRLNDFSLRRNTAATRKQHDPCPYGSPVRSRGLACGFLSARKATGK